MSDLTGMNLTMGVVGKESAMGTGQPGVVEKGIILF